MHKRSLFTFLLLAVVAAGIVFLQNQGDQKIDKTNPALIPDKDTKTPHIEEGGAEELDNPQLAAEHHFEMTKDPALGYPPTMRKLAAYDQVKRWQSQQTISRSAIPGVQWIERGPNNLGGRTREVMFDPSDETFRKVWAGSTGGGLWYNNDITNPEHTWQQADGIMTNLAVSALAYDPTSTQTFYLGTGLGYTGRIRGAGIWKSTDGGDTWNQLASTSSFTFIQKIVVTDAGVVLASTLDGLRRSTDGGTTWTTTLVGRTADIEIASDGDIYATRGVNSPGDIFKSTDNGITWTDVSPSGGQPARIEIAVAPSNAEVIYAVADRLGAFDDNDVAYFQKSTDGGETWENITIPNYLSDNDCSLTTTPFTRGQAFFDLILRVHPQNENIVIAGGIDLHRSSDGGTNWESLSYWIPSQSGGACDDYVHADIHDMQFRPNYPNQLVTGTDGGIFYSADAGNASNPTFDSRNNGYNTALAYSVAMTNEVNSNVLFTGLQDNGTHRFSDPGINSTREVFGGDGVFTFVDQDDPNFVIVSITNNVYLLSTDGGQTISANLIVDQNRGRFVNPADYDSEANILYSAGNANELVRVDGVTGGSPTNTVLSLTDLGGNQISSVTVSPNVDNRIYVGVDDGSIFRIDNANTATPTVTDITGTFEGSPGDFVSSIAIGDTEDKLLATYSNFGTTSVYQTTDGGANWTNKEDNLPDMPVYWGLYNPNNTDQVLLATEMGVWSTNNINDANPNWEPSNSGLASVRVTMLRYRTADETVAASTFGRGIFTSNIFATTKDANFKTNQIVSYVGTPVQFEDASLLPNDSWSWDFGDNGTSSLQNPTHTYETPGTYDISLSIDNGADTETKTGYVTILPVKAVPYAPADGGDFESNETDFTSRSLLNGVNMWQRGAPGNRLTTVASGTNAWKTNLTGDLVDEGFDYASALYTPAFDLSDTQKDYTVSFRLSAENSFCNAPFAMILQFSTDGGKNWFRLGSSNSEFGAVNWYNQGDNTGCSIDQQIFENGEGWNFVNIVNQGNTFDLSIDNELTQHKLNSLAGNSNVSFRFLAKVVTGFSTYDRDGFMVDDFQIIAESPQADFDAEVNTTYIGRNIQFNYRSNGAQTFSWNFGDGNVSTQENPMHSYSAAGTYDVSLTVTSTSGNDTEIKTGFITILPERAIPYELADGGDFESNNSDFGAVNVVGTPFELGSSSVTGKDGTASGSNAWVTDLDAAQYVDDSEARLMTPSFQMLAFGDYTFEFKANFSFEPTWDGFIVQYTTDKGETWTKLNDNVEAGWYNQTSDADAVFGNSVPIFSGTTNGSFQTFSTDVSFLVPNESVAFRFLFLTDANTVDVGAAIDDFQLIGPAPGPAVPDFTFTGNTGCAGQQVVFTNASTGTISALNWDFGANATPANATGQGPHTVTYDGSGPSTVTLSVESPVNGTQTETKTNAIETTATFTPSFTEEPTQNFTTVLTATSGDSYQWFVDGTAIDGATSQAFEAEESGDYSVAVTIGSCTIQTSQSSVITSTEEDRIFSKNVSVYPNPTSGITKVKVEDAVTGKLTLNIFDATGATMLSREVDKVDFEEIYEIDMASLKQGVYLIEIRSSEAKTIKRIIRE